MNIDEEIQKLIDAFAESVIERARRNLKVTRTRTGYRKENGSIRTYKYKSNAYASGKLYDSLSYNIVKKSGGIQVKFYGKGTQKYADVMEEGRRPNSTPPPIAPIEAWIKLKNIKSRSRAGKFVKRQSDKSLAIAISKKIGEFGIEGIHYWRDAIDAELEVLDGELEKKIEMLITTKINEGWL